MSMKRQFLIFTIILSCISYSAVNAQILTNREKRNIYSKALTLLEKYEACSELYDYDAEYDFQRLFTDRNIRIVCDLPGTSGYLNNLTIQEYINLARNESATTSMSIENVRKGELRYENGAWILPLTFRKNVSFVDNNGIMFSTDEFHSAGIDMSMELRYDSLSGECTIESIDGKVTSSRPYPKDRFFVIEKSFKNTLNKKSLRYVPSLTIDGRPLNFNSYDQAIMPAGKPALDDFEAVVDTVLLKKGENYDLISFRITPPRTLRTKVRFGFAPAGAYNVSSSDIVGSRSSAFEVGVDFGKVWPTGKTTRIGVFTGVAMNFSLLSLSLKENISYQYNTLTYNSEDKSYITHPVSYSIDFASEGLKFMDLVVPVYMELEHWVNKFLLISWNVGAKIYGNLLTKVNPYHVAGSVRTNTITSQFDTDFEQFLAPVSYRRSPVDVSLAASAGVDVNVLKNILYVNVNIGYEYGLTKSYKAQGISPYYKPGKVYPILYSRNGNVAMHSMIAGTSYRRQALWICLGVKLKL